MRTELRHAARCIGLSLRRGLDAVLGRLAVLLLKAIRCTNPDRMADFSGRFLRAIGPWLPEHRVGRANLAAAFPEWSEAEIERMLDGVWDNLGRLGAEFAHLDRLWDYDPTRPGDGRIELAPDSLERFLRLRDDAKPALIFAAHLANWELPALAAAAHGLDAALLYRAPNLAHMDRLVRDMRAVRMGMLIPTGLDAPVRIADAMARGVHIGMLIDQYYVRGVDVTFFGQRTKANPLLARLARRIDCPIHGTRVIRLPDHRFRVELTEAIEPRRNAQGEVDIAATMQAVTSVVEGWIREHPEQWLWLHRRWR